MRALMALSVGVVLLMPWLGDAWRLGLVAVSVLAWTLLYRRHDARDAPTDVYGVLITGCDTGLGFSLALHAHGMGLTVIAACLQLDGSGAQKLMEVCGPDRMHVVEMDVTDDKGVRKAADTVKVLLQNKPTLQLKGLVNNAAVMVFGEFEWQTDQQVRQQVEVNLLGTMRVTRTFCSLLRKYQGRIVVVSSHCADASLPGVAAYGATKGGLRSWADSLRVEQAKYGVHVISFVPGSFINKSCIMARHGDHAKEMEAALSAEDRAYFGEYFHHYHAYLSGLSVPDRPPVKMVDPALYDMFEAAMLSRQPRALYVHEPLRYALYHLAFKVAPTWLRDKLAVRFVKMPTWRPV